MYILYVSPISSNTSNHKALCQNSRLKTTHVGHVKHWRVQWSRLSSLTPTYIAWQTTVVCNCNQLYKHHVPPLQFQTAWTHSALFMFELSKSPSQNLVRRSTFGSQHMLKPWNCWVATPGRPWYSLLNLFLQHPELALGFSSINCKATWSWFLFEIWWNLQKNVQRIVKNCKGMSKIQKYPKIPTNLAIFEKSEINPEIEVFWGLSSSPPPCRLRFFYPVGMWLECHDSDDDSSMLYRRALVTRTSRTATGFLLAVQLSPTPVRLPTLNLQPLLHCIPFPFSGLQPPLQLLLQRFLWSAEMEPSPTKEQPWRMHKKDAQEL